MGRWCWSRACARVSAPPCCNCPLPPAPKPGRSRQRRRFASLLFRPDGTRAAPAETSAGRASRSLKRPQPGLIYGAAVSRRLRAMGIRDKPIAPSSPWQNAYVVPLTVSKSTVRTRSVSSLSIMACPMPVFRPHGMRYRSTPHPALRRTSLWKWNFYTTASGWMCSARFATAAEAIRFAVEELPAMRSLGAWMQVGDQRFDGDDIQRLYESDDYPLQRRLSE